VSRRKPQCILNVDDALVNAAMVILGIRLADAMEAFTARPGHHVRRDDQRFVTLRRRLTLGLRELVFRGRQLSFPEIAELVGAPNHSTVIGRCQTARRLGLLTESELHSLRGGAA